MNASTLVAPSASNNATPLSVEKKDEKEVHWLLAYITCLLSLADFGILGVLARYGFEKLYIFIVRGTSDYEYFMYTDLPPNMVGSFLMGWLGVVFKPDIMKVSDQLAIGLTTGFLGSLTTFSGWNQKMLDISTKGKWVFSLLGIPIGLLAVYLSIILGILTTRGFKWLLRRSTMKCHHSFTLKKSKCLLSFMVMLLLMLVLLWGIFASLETLAFKDGGTEAQLFLACIVGPVGVWIRYFLARFNGPGLGKNGVAKWMPFGTLAANIIAACVMAALATIKKTINTKNCDTLATGIQFGLLGCLSTVSTFISEFHALIVSDHPWRAFAYAALTFTPSFVLGTLIYSVPVWTKGYS